MAPISALKLQKKDYLFSIERLISRTNIPFLRGMIFFSLFMFGMQWLVAFATGIISKLDPFDIYWQVMWTWPGSVALVTTMFFSRLLRDKTLTCISEVSPFIRSEEHVIIERRLKKIFVERYHVTFPLFFSFIFAVPFQVYFLILRPWDFFWSELYQYSYHGALAYGIFGVIHTWVWAFFILTLGYFSLGIAYTLYKLEKQLRPLSVEDIDRGALKPLGSLLMTMTASFLLGIAVNLSLILIAPIAWWGILEIVLFIAAALLLFFVPLYNLHAVIVKMKEEELRDAKKRWWKAIKKLDSSRMNVMKDIEQRIEKIPSWPFDVKMLIELAGYILVPLLIWVASYFFR